MGYKSLFLVASLAEFLCGGIAGLGMAAGAITSLSSSSTSRVNVALRWRLWIVLTLFLASRLKSALGALGMVQARVGQKVTSTNLIVRQNMYLKVMFSGVLGQREIELNQK